MPFVLLVAINSRAAQKAKSKINRLEIELENAFAELGGGKFEKNFDVSKAKETVQKIEEKLSKAKEAAVRADKRVADANDAVANAEIAVTEADKELCAAEDAAFKDEAAVAEASAKNASNNVSEPSSVSSCKTPKRSSIS